MSPLSARLLILLLFALPCSVEARTVVVDTTADDPALITCDDAVSNDCSLRGAIAAANAAAEHYDIQLPSGTYTTSVVSSCTFVSAYGGNESFSATTLCINKDVAIIGSGAHTTTIDGLHSDRVIALDKTATAAISGVTITRGVIPNVGTFIGGGGGILNHGTLTLADVAITANTGGPGGGGGIFNAGTLTVVRSTIAGNDDVHEGGGIYNRQLAILTVSDSTISDNITGSVGGGICNFVGIVTITNSTVSSNAADSLGGGIANFGGNFVGNLTVINSTISGNTSGSSGGGLYNDGATDVHLNNVTISDNTGAVGDRGDGGGVSNDRGGGFVMRNTVIAGNRTPLFTSRDCSTGTQLASAGHNLVGDTAACAISGDVTGNLLNVDPKLGALADNGGPTRTHGIEDGSPAIDAGNPIVPGSGGTACAASDQRGQLRPLGTACDIGAFERSTILAVSKITPSSGGNDGSVVALLAGGGFAPGATGALLRRAGHADIAGSPVASEPGGAALTTTFDLTGADLGIWDVVVMNPDLTSATLPDGFTVEAPRAADLFAVVLARSSARPGLSVRFAVIYGNHGNTDALGVPLTLGLPASFARQFSVEVAPPPAQPGQPFNDYSDVPIAVTVPVASDQVDIPLLVPIVPAGFTGLLAFTLTPPAGTSGTEFTVEAHFGTPWFANGAVRADVVAEAAVRARQAADRLGVTAGPELDPVLVDYETAALDLAVASSRDDLVGNLGQSRRVFSVAYFSVDLAGYVAAHTVAKAAPTPLTWLAALPQRLGRSFGLVASTAEARAICPPCLCGAVIQPGCTGCTDAQCVKPIDPDNPPKKPPPGLTPGECNNQPKHIVSADGTRCKPDGSTPCPKGIGTPFHTDPWCRTYPIKDSFDPNDKAGSGGSGPERFVSPGTPMPYVIAFENLPAATAAAQTVVVTDQLDTRVLDLDSFTLGPILIGNIGITPPPGLATFSGGADLRPAHNVLVRVDAALDKATGNVTWRFTSLDPSTMETLTDPDEGFLPPNTNPPAGDGQVHFTILPKAGLAPGTEIRNHARVVFDTNAPIDTPEWLNTVGGPPCVGDCNHDDHVAINELILGVNIALGRQPLNACPVFANSQGTVNIAQLIKGVHNALNGCGG